MATDQGPFYRSLGLRLARARKVAGMTQQALAGALGLSRTSITNVEKGRQPIQVHVLVEAAIILGKDVTDLLPVIRRKADARANELAAPFPAEKRAWIENVIAEHAKHQEDGDDR